MRIPIEHIPIRRPKAPTVLASVALFLAIGGPAAAVDTADAGVRLITGKQIKNNSIDSRDIKDGSLTAKDFKKGVLPGPAASGSPGTPQGPRDGAQGEGGAQGQSGDRGPQGEQGPRGEGGAAGERGPQGLPGAQGPAGERGANGPQGPKGDKGDQGAKGDKGDKGDTGPAGVPAAPEAIRIVGTSGQPGFAKDVGFPGYEWWHANDHNVNQAGFYKDAFGVVHLKGKVKCVGTTCNSASLIYQLPAGYRPAQNHIFLQSYDATGTGSGTTPARVNVESSGWISRAPAPLTSQNGFVSLDGITFRAEQ